MRTWVAIVLLTGSLYWGTAETRRQWAGIIHAERPETLVDRSQAAVAARYGAGVAFVPGSTRTAATGAQDARLWGYADWRGKRAVWRTVIRKGNLVSVELISTGHGK